MTVEELNHNLAIDASLNGDILPTQRQLAIDRCAKIAALIDRHTDSKGNIYYPTAIDPLVFLRCDTSKSVQAVSEPLFALVVQGEKKLLLNEEKFQYGVAQYLVMSVDLPLSVCMVEAPPDRPYLGLKLKLDPVQLCEIIAQTNPDNDRKENSVRGWCVSDGDLSLLDCVTRLVNLLETPQDIPFLAPMMIREIYYRLLTKHQGEAIRQVATAGSNMQRIAEVIKRLKADFAQPLRVEDLAEQANMSTASFHRHFKAVTSMSPLQYQKQLRLLTARQIMLAEKADAVQAAYQVGYESASQFSREYVRMFGAPPIRDVERLRTTETVLSR